MLTDASVIDVESLQLSMAPNSAVTLENATFTIGTESNNGQVYLQCTATVTKMSGSYPTATFTINGTANGAFYNTNIQIEATAAVSKYTLKTTDYVSTTEGTVLNDNSNSITLTQTSGAQFKFEDYINTDTLTNAYGSWKICAYGGPNKPGEEINVSTPIEVPETNRNYFLVFTSNNEMYCPSETLSLTVYASTSEA